MTTYRWGEETHEPTFRKGPPDEKGRRPLTPRQREVLDVMKAFHRDRGFMPTYRELSNLFGWSGPASARNHVQLLELKGWVLTVPNAARAIQILDD
jgi:repressor LexA